ncbi:MAG: ATP-binding protein [Anaerolineae bacterium]
MEPGQASAIAGRGLAVQCDLEGTVIEVVRDDLGLASGKGRPFSLLVDRASLAKALDMFVALRAQGTAFGWELNVPTGEGIATLQFAGVLDGERLWIVGAESDVGLLELYQALTGINNEQANALRAALKENAALRDDAATGSQTERQARVALAENADTLGGTLSVYDELSQLNNELANLQRELAKKNAELERLNLVKDQFLGMAAHDLRTPLSVVLGYSSFLQEDLGESLSQEHAEFLSVIRSSSRFMLHLVNSLLDVATIESGKLELDLQPTDLAALVARNVALNATLAEPKGIGLVCRCDPDLPPMLLDGPRIEQVLNNLLSNAVKFSFPDTTVQVNLARQGGHVVLSVTDHGRGIPEDQLDELFKWFAQTRVKGTAGETGTGLGLAISQKIVEAHQGDIWVESVVDRGSTFYVYLPVKDGSRG